MSWTIAKKTIDAFFKLILEQKANKINIRFFGGEPLINWEIVVKSVEYIKTIKPDKLDINYVINTNGTLLDHEKCRFLSENNVYIALSLDGIQQDHDTYRTYLDGRGSFSIIDKNLKYLADNNCRFNITTVCTDKNLPNLNKFIDYLSDKQKELNYEIPICFNFVSITNKKEIDNLSNEQKVALLLDALNYSKEKQIYCFGGFTHFAFQSFLNNNIGTHCVGSGGEFSVDPDGDIYPCSSVDIKLGNIEKFEEIFKTDLYKKVYNHRCGKIKQCKNCEIEGFCGGGCIAETKTENGTYFGEFKNCELEKLLFKELVKHYLLND